MTGFHKTTERRRLKVFEMYLGGRSYSEIGKAVGVSRQYVQQLVRPPKPVYDAVKQRAAGKCEKCGIYVQNGHIHHIQQSGKTPDDFNEPANLQYLCPSCQRDSHSDGIGTADSAFSCSKCGSRKINKDKVCRKCGSIEVRPIFDQSVKTR